MSSIPHITVQLVHLQGPLKGEIQEFTDDEIRLGRHPDCQVRFPKEMVTLSRVHARIVREGNRFKVIDQSTNGTYVNGQRSAQSYLKDGDVLMLAEGGPKISFLTQISDAPPMAKPSPATSAARAYPSAPPEPVPHPAPVRRHPSGPSPAPVAPGQQTSPPFQPPSSVAPPLVETVKAPLAIQYGPALKSFQTLPIVVGSDPGCDFVIAHSGIHGRHAQFFFVQNRYWIKDLTGLNCVTVNGQPLQAQIQLEPNAEISLGRNGPRFKFLAGGRLAQLDEPVPQPSAPQPPSEQSPPLKQERSEKLSHKAGGHKAGGHKAGGLIKKFFS